MPTREYNPSLDGVRAVASFGIMATHVAFQTGVDPAGHVGAVLARFDFFVPVFFALSAFLLWGGAGRYRGRWGGYYRNRAARILPAYLVCVGSVILLLPDAAAMGAAQVLANLTLTQIYVPDGLAPGLTHLWSLAVEVAFYLALPLFAVLLLPLPRRGRILAILCLAVLSLGWAWLPFVESTPAPGVANRQIWPPAYLCWFAVGMLAAEYAERVGPRWRRAFEVRWAWWLAALAIAWLAGQEFFGPLGLTHPSPPEFALRVLAGAAFAFVVVVPHALAPGDRVLTSRPAQFLGRISYSVFLWHLPIMALVFPLAGIEYFQGGFLPVYALTAVATTVVAACSYEFVEEPARRLIRGGGTRQASAAAHTAASAVSSPA